MQTKELKITVILLVLVGIFSSCKQNDDIDMSNIDFSNIENLYAQPLPIIQKCVQGKWKVYAEYGGVVGISYPEDTYIEINDDHFITTSHDGNQHNVSYFIWKRHSIDDKGKTWVMWDKERNQGINYFSSIKNDTLGVGSVPPPGDTFWPFGSSYVRVK